MDSSLQSYTVLIQIGSKLTRPWLASETRTSTMLETISQQHLPHFKTRALSWPLSRLSEANLPGTNSSEVQVNPTPKEISTRCTKAKSKKILEELTTTYSTRVMLNKKRAKLIQMTPARVISIKCPSKVASLYSWLSRTGGGPSLLLSPGWSGLVRITKCPLPRLRMSPKWWAVCNWKNWRRI